MGPVPLSDQSGDWFPSPVLYKPHQADPRDKVILAGVLIDAEG